MYDQIQPLMLMMFSSMKQGENDNIFTKYLPLFILLIPIINRIIPFEEIKDYIKKYFDKNNDFNHIDIPSHERQIIKGFTSTPIYKKEYSDDFKAINHYIINNKISNIESLTEIMISNSELSSYEDRKLGNKYIYIPINNKRILISESEKIYFQLIDVDNKVEEDENKNDKKVKNSKTKNFIITLYINKKIHNGIYILQNFIKKCKTEYDIYHNKNNNDNKLYIFDFKLSENIDSVLELKFTKDDMTHNKDLSKNIFFEGKEELINYIKPFIYDPFEKFNIGEEKYKRCGFTFKAGLLFYGAPGCGKTSTIKGILRYTNRHGIMINLSKVKTCEELELIFRNRTINGQKYSGKQLCYILEECDAFDNNFLKSRKLKEDEDLNKNLENNDVLQISKLVEYGKSTVEKMMVKDDDKINLLSFLNTLDGPIELDGIMYVMTTNHPEKIDEALLRPGRFDFKYEFKKASKKIVINMLQHTYELTDKQMEEYIQYLNIKDEVLSPAEIQSICFKNDNIRDSIDKILLLAQK